MDGWMQQQRKHHIPSGQDLGGPFWFCPCIPTRVPDGPGGGMLGPIIPKEKNKYRLFNVKWRILHTGLLNLEKRTVVILQETKCLRVQATCFYSVPIRQ